MINYYDEEAMNSLREANYCFFNLRYSKEKDEVKE